MKFWSNQRVGVNLLHVPWLSCAVIISVPTPAYHATTNTIQSLLSKVPRKLPQIVQCSNDIQDYELLSTIGVMDDISHLYLARFKPTGQLLAMKFTDLNMTVDYELLTEMTVGCVHLPVPPTPL